MSFPKHKHKYLSEKEKQYRNLKICQTKIKLQIYRYRNITQNHKKKTAPTASEIRGTEKMIVADSRKKQVIKREKHIRFHLTPIYPFENGADDISSGLAALP